MKKDKYTQKVSEHLGGMDESTPMVQDIAALLREVVAETRSCDVDECPCECHQRAEKED